MAPKCPRSRDLNLPYVRLYVVSINSRNCWAVSWLEIPAILYLKELPVAPVD